MTNKKNKEEKHNPTPYLAIPNSKRQMFTYSENKLLDQITTEIMEAWAKDLKVIRQCQKKTLEASECIKNVNYSLTQSFSKIDEFLTKEENILNLKLILERQTTLFGFIQEIRNDIFEINNKINYSYVKKLNEDIKNLTELAEVIKNSTQKKWWQFWR